MARHRSPRGRRAHLRFPLPALAPAAGAGGADRSVPIDLPTPSLRAVVATAVAGSVAAAAGQAALVGALPAVADGTNVLRSAVPALASLGTAPAAATAPVPLRPVAPVAPEPLVADAAALVKGAELARAAEERAAQAARAAEAKRAAAEKPAAAERPAPERKATSTAGGGVQMVVGRVTSGFGARWGSQHTGLDIAAPIGTPIRVPLGGTVTDSGPASGFGQWVRVRHDDGTTTVYGHINRSHVGVGDRVSAGDTIAEVGNRGRSTGPHLHFEVITGGEKINPRPWLDERGIGY